MMGTPDWAERRRLADEDDKSRFQPQVVAVKVRESSPGRRREAAEQKQGTPRGVNDNLLKQLPSPHTRAQVINNSASPAEAEKAMGEIEILSYCDSPFIVGYFDW